MTIQSPTSYGLSGVSSLLLNIAIVGERQLTIQSLSSYSQNITSLSRHLFKYPPYEHFPCENNKFFLFRYLRNVSVETEPKKPHAEFTQDGVLKKAELKIMNLRPGANRQGVWEEVGI